MTLKGALRVMAVVIASVVVAAAADQPKHSGKVSFNTDVSVAGSQIAGGNYDVQWETHSPEATVTFMRGKKAVATAQGKVVDRGTKFESDSVVYDASPDGGHDIREIRFRGSSEVIVFKE